MANPQKTKFIVDVSTTVRGKYEVEAWNHDDAYLKAEDLASKGIPPVISSIDTDECSLECLDAYPAPRGREITKERNVARELVLEGTDRVAKDTVARDTMDVIKDISRAMDDLAKRSI